MKPFSHYECRQKHSVYAVFRPLLPDVNEETQSAEENAPSKPEAVKTMSKTIPETARNFNDIASFPDDSEWIKESTIALIFVILQSNVPND